MADSEVTIRECVSVEDFKQCVELERCVWHDDDVGLMPIRLYMISKTCNAPTIGAFDDAAVFCQRRAVVDRIGIALHREPSPPQ